MSFPSLRRVYIAKKHRHKFTSLSEYCLQRDMNHDMYHTEVDVLNWMRSCDGSFVEHVIRHRGMDYTVFHTRELDLYFSECSRSTDTCDHNVVVPY